MRPVTCPPNSPLATEVAATKPDLGHAESCHAPTKEVLVPGGVTLSINPEARVYASLYEPRVHRISVGTECPVPVAIQNLGFTTSSIHAEIIEPKDGSVHLTWESEPLTGSAVDHRTIGVTSQLGGFVEVTISFCLPFGLPDLGERDRIRLVLCVAPHEEI